MKTRIFFTALFLSIVVFMLVEIFFCFAVLSRENNPSAQTHQPSVMEITETKPNQFRIKQEVIVEIEGEDKPSLVAEWLTMAVVG